jgi:nitrite reductase/ring-hydroxylating ferredoxin subunit
MTTKYEICHLDDLPEGGSRGFTIETGADTREIFVIREGNHVYGYVNSCPHTSVNLDWNLDQFLDSIGEFIQCSTHGARFRIRDGYCVYGPCAGRSLTSIPLEINDGQITLNI